MSDELMPCPMCGKAVAAVTTASEMWPEWEDEGNAESYAVMCDAHMPGGPGGCGASGGFAPTEEQAIALWNRRATPVPEQAQPVGVTEDAVNQVLADWMRATKRGFLTGSETEDFCLLIRASIALAPARAPTPPTVEQSIGLLVSALAASKGWMRDYADAIIRDAIDRVEPVKEADVIDADLVKVAIEHGWGTELRDAGYANDVLWFDGDPLPMLRAVLALRGGTP